MLRKYGVTMVITTILACDDTCLPHQMEKHMTKLKKMLSVRVRLSCLSVPAINLFLHGSITVECKKGDDISWRRRRSILFSEPSPLSNRDQILKGLVQRKHGQNDLQLQSVLQVRRICKVSRVCVEGGMRSLR